MQFKNQAELQEWIKHQVDTQMAEREKTLKEEYEAALALKTGEITNDLTTRFDTQEGLLKQIFGGRQEETPEEVEKGVNIAKFARALAAGKGELGRAAKYAEERFGKSSKVVEGFEKALASNDYAAGGAFIPPGFVNEIIEFLRPASVVRRMQPVEMGMPKGTLNIPALTGGSQAYYVGENKNGQTTNIVTGSVKLVFKKLAAILPISNDFIRYEMQGADTMIRNDLINAVAQRSDLAFIRGDGSEDTPKGIRNLLDASNEIAQTGATADDVINDLAQLILALEGNNVNMYKPGWLFTPRTKTFLMTLRDTNGYIFRDEMLQGTLWTYPYATTTQIPNNLGGGTESEIYFVDFSDVVIGDSLNMAIDMSDTAAYHDGSQVVAAFSKDQTVMRVIAEHDIGMRHRLAASVLTGVTWGA